MPDSYTYIPKPTGTPWNTVNPQGKQTYDQSDIIYDDPAVLYDSIDTTAWTDVAKPSDSNSGIRVGMITGLVMPVTYSRAYPSGSAWTKVNKPV